MKYFICAYMKDVRSQIWRWLCKLLSYEYFPHKMWNYIQKVARFSISIFNNKTSYKINTIYHKLWLLALLCAGSCNSQILTDIWRSIFQSIFVAIYIIDAWKKSGNHNFNYIMKLWYEMTDFQPLCMFGFFFVIRLVLLFFPTDS